MPFAFEPVDPQTSGTLSKWDIPLNRWLGVKWGIGLDSRVGEALNRFGQDMTAGGDILSPDEANERFALPTLKFTSPVSVGRAELMHARKLRELDQQAYLNSASHSWYSGKAIAGFGALMAGSMAHPVDAGLMFLPMVGSEAKAAGIARLGGGTFRQALARGIITEETIAGLAPRLPRFTARVVEGTLNQALMEVPVFVQKIRDQAIYGPEDAAVNIIGGGLVAGGIHLALKGLSGALSRAGDAVRGLTPEIKELMTRKAMDDFAKGNDISVHDLIRIDENAIRNKVQFDEASARIQAESLETPPATKPLGEFETETLGLKPGVEVLTGPADNPEFGRVVGASVDNPGAITVRFESGFRDMKATEITPVEREPNVEAINAERDRRVKLYVEQKRAEFEAQKPELVRKAVEEEIRRQQAEGKLLTEEQAKQYSGDIEDASVITADAANIEKGLDLEEGKAPNAPELGKPYVEKSKGIQAAIGCITESILRG